MGVMDLFRPKWKHSDYRIRTTAVESLNDYKILADIAIDDCDARVREVALKKITNQSVGSLTHISDDLKWLLSCASAGIAIAVVERIKQQCPSQLVYAYIEMLDSPHSSVRIHAALALGDLGDNCSLPALRKLLEKTPNKEEYSEWGEIRPEGPYYGAKADPGEWGEVKRARPSEEYIKINSAIEKITGPTKPCSEPDGR